MIGKTIDELKVGDTAEFTKTVSEADIYMYAGVTGDVNPAHIDEVYASDTFFKTRIAHGMLLAGFISTVLGNRLPGNGTIYMKQELEFLAPVHIGDTVTARAEVVEVVKERNQVKLRTTCVKQDGTTVVGGEALVSPPKAPKRSG
jgi:3-hydroxybutyryl-CoA dehydratase